MGNLKKIKIINMMKKRKHLRVGCKFLLIVFIICFIPICLSSYDLGIDPEGNMITIRTIFSSIMGYIIENVSSRSGKEMDPLKEANKKQEDDEKEVPKMKEEYKKQLEDGQYECDEACELEARVLIIGHLLLCIIVVLVIGALFDINQSNQSLILLKNTAFACVGFLISATKTNLNNKKR